MRFGGDANAEAIPSDGLVDLAPAELEARWQGELEVAHHRVAPVFYGLAIVGLLAGSLGDAHWIPAIAHPVMQARWGLAGCALVALVAVRTRKARGEYALAAFLLLTNCTFAIACSLAVGPEAMSTASAAFAVPCFLWPPTLMLSRPVLPAVVSATSVLVYAISTALYGALPWTQVFASGGFVIVFLATTSPFIYAVRYRLVRSNFDLRYQLEQRNRRFAALAVEVEALASIDALTGAYNRRVGLLMLGKLLALAKRGADPFTIAYVDVDNLKVVNDTLGHAAGDELIRTVASTLHRSVRNADVVVRLGGDEFCLGLPNCSAAQAAKVAARIDANLAALSTDPGSTRVVRVSHGFGEYSGGKLEPDVDALLEKADAEMYAAKQAKKKARAGS